MSRGLTAHVCIGLTHSLISYEPDNDRYIDRYTYSRHAYTGMYMCVYVCLISATAALVLTLTRVLSWR